MSIAYYLHLPIPKDLKQQLKKAVDQEDILEINNLMFELENYRIRIGQYSYGYQFLWESHKWKYFSPNMDSIKNWLSTGTIYDEYNNKYSLDQFWGEIKDALYNDREHKCLMDNPEYSTNFANYEQYFDGLRFTKGRY